MSKSTHQIVHFAPYKNTVTLQRKLKIQQKTYCVGRSFSEGLDGVHIHLHSYRFIIAACFKLCQ
jgi:hypothetical protein